jgi:hypothetical protein
MNLPQRIKKRVRKANMKMKTKPTEKRTTMKKASINGATKEPTGTGTTARTKRPTNAETQCPIPSILLSCWTRQLSRGRSLLEIALRHRLRRHLTYLR